MSKEVQIRVKNIIRSIIKEEVSKVLNEAHPETYYIAYYSTVGEHGEVGTFGDFKSACRSALNKMKSKNGEGESFLEGLEYVGVEATWEGTPEFAIMYVTKDYIRRINSNWFNSPEDAKAFKTAAEQCLQTGKPVIGKYPKKDSK